MGKWSGTGIQTQEEKIAQLRFTGKFERESIEEALLTLQITAGFSFTLNGKKIITY